MHTPGQDTYVQHVDGFLRVDNALAGDLETIKRVLHAERLEIVHINPRVLMLLDADAQAQLLPVNPEANAIYRKAGHQGPTVRGNVVLDWTDNYPPGALPSATQEPA